VVHFLFGVCFKADAPLGELRFVASQPADGWNSELDARQEGPIPLQMDRRSGKVIGSEDCLYLNVYTKHVSNVGIVKLHNSFIGKKNSS